MPRGNEKLTGNHIGGEEVPAISGRSRQKLAPATGETLGAVAESSGDDVNAAVEAASKGAEKWRGMSVAERRAAMMAWAANLRSIGDKIALLDARDSGSPIGHTRSGLVKGIEHLEHFAGLGYELTGRTIPATAGNLHYTVREPYGVVGILTPFNHPSFFPIKLSAPALAAGNAVVIKPSEQTPLSATVIAEAARGALPDGVVNVVQGGPEAGKALVQHPRVDRLHLTGGVPTGLAVQQAAASSGRVKNVTLELGGKNPLIVFSDVDAKVAAAAAVAGMNFGHQGQSCGSTSRLFIHKSIAREVTELIVDRVSKIRLGLPDREETEMGSMVSKRHQERVLAWIEAGSQEGGTLLTGGHTPDGDLANGCYVQPTVFGDIDPYMAIAQNEIFGPVLSIIPWDDEEEMLHAVNSTDYGLTAAIYTQDISKALTTASRVESGFVWINGVERRWLSVPFGGYKNSGLGQEHAHETMESYTRQKSVSVILNGASVQKDPEPR